MQVRDIMTQKVDCATPDTDLRDVARMMADDDVGAIPVIESRESNKPVGIVTDRDITTRCIAKGHNPLEKKVRDCMSKSIQTVRPEMELDQCLMLMEQKQIRRAPVIDKQGQICGIVSQADIALKLQRPEQTAEFLKDVSMPSTGQQAQHVHN